MLTDQKLPVRLTLHRLDQKIVGGCAADNDHVAKNNYSTQPERSEAGINQRDERAGL